MSEKLSLPFDVSVQQALVGYMIKEPQFFNQCKNKIKPTWFIDRHLGKIYDIMLKFQTQFNRAPSQQEVQSHREWLLEDTKTRVKLGLLIADCVKITQKYGLDLIRNELTEWLHSVTFQADVQKAVELFNQKKIHESYNHISELTAKLRDIKFDEGNAVDFSNFNEYLKESEQTYEHALTTGLTLLDRALIEDGTGGGLVLGDMTVVLAPVNVGKTSYLVSVAKHNIEAGKNILFMTHEGTPKDIRQKILCSLLGVTRAGLFELHRTEQGRKIIEAGVNKINEHLTYMPYNKPGMCVEDVEPIIHRHAENLALKGQKLHLLIDDYPAKLGTQKNSRGASPQRITDQIVYNYFTQMCLDLDVHGLVAAQTNREGSKINKGKESRLLKIEDVAESWGICQTATNVISLNRDPEGPFSHIMTFYVAKSRSSRVGTAVAAKSDFARALTHSNEMGACAYWSDVPMADRIDSFLETHKNTMLPAGAVSFSKEVKGNNNAQK